MLSTFKRRCFSTKTIQKFPWNFYAVPERRDVGNLLTALPIEQILKYRQVVGLFKSYIQGLADRDYDLLQDIMEPHMF